MLLARFCNTGADYFMNMTWREINEWMKTAGEIAEREREHYGKQT